MKITALKTEKVTPRSTTLMAFLDRHLKRLPEHSILVITSKIVALCEGRYINHDSSRKDNIIQQEADYYLPEEKSRYGIPLTIKDNAFIARAGMDASNTGGYYSLLPKNSYRTARAIRASLVKRFSLQDVGVIIVDSHSTPLRRGTLGVAIGWSGFRGIKAYEKLPDIFGHLFTTHQNIVDGLASAASLVMGEGAEQTPLTVIENIPFVSFNAASPTVHELAFFKPKLTDDLFAPLLKWQDLKQSRRKK